jgi:SAM-dependent methyltransferase
MDNNNTGIPDDEINVEEVMEKIRENIRRRQEAGEVPTDPDSCATASENCFHDQDDAIQRDLVYINSNWDIHNNSYIISSDRRYIGRALIKGRNLVHGEVRRYVDPIIYRQNGFNASTVRILNHSSQKSDELCRNYQGLDQKIRDLDNLFSRRQSDQDQKIRDLDNLFSRRQSDQDQKISQIKDMMENEIDGIIDARIHSHLFELDENIHARTWLAQILENRIREGFERKIPAPDQYPLTKSEQPPSSMNYYLFEERFRGSRIAIKDQQLAFLPYFEKCSSVLDIGCGRGEFLEILRDHEIGYIGIDIDKDMVQYCRSKHLNVEQIDAISYLEKLPDNCLDGIFIDQVIEHLEPNYLVRMLPLCYQKLNSGGNIVVETVNPLSLASFFNFYLDLSHYKPVHPLTLQFLLESVGFIQNEIKYYSPIPDEVKLQKIELPEKFSDIEHEIIKKYNYTIEMLNNMLWGPRDYAAIGKK